jgi:hypothetical protein
MSMSMVGTEVCSVSRSARVAVYATPLAALVVLYYQMISSTLNFSEARQPGTATVCRLLLQVQRRIARSGQDDSIANGVQITLSRVV